MAAAISFPPSALGRANDLRSVAGGAAAPARGRRSCVADFGAIGDGADADRDTTAFLQAFDKGQGGRVEIPGGRYLLRPDRLSLPAGTILEGAGYGTVLARSGAGRLLGFSGEGSGTHARHSALRDVRLVGSGCKGELLDIRFGDNLLVDNVNFEDNDDTAVALTECWDSRFQNCVFERVGAASLGPAVRIRNTPRNGFGLSADNSNQIHFVGCRWEQFRDGALWIGDPRDGNVANGINLVDCKMETSRLDGPIVSVLGPTRGLFIVNLYLAVNALGRAAPNPGRIDLVMCRSLDKAALRAIDVYTAVPVRSDIRLQGCNRVEIAGVFHDGAAPPSQSVVDVDDEKHRAWITDVDAPDGALAVSVTR